MSVTTRFQVLHSQNSVALTLPVTVYVTKAERETPRQKHFHFHTPFNTITVQLYLVYL